MERITDISQVFEEIQMIFVNIQDYADLREEMQETVRIFTGFCDKIFRITYTDVTADSLLDAADRDGRIQFSGK